MNTPVLSAKAIFDHAIELTSPAERQAYLDQACADAPQLRERVEALLRMYQELGSFLEEPAAAVFETGEYRPSDVHAPEEPPAGAEPPSPPTIVGALVVPATPEGPGSRIGPYKLLQPLGKGGMGVVWMAEQEQPVRRRVALKVIKPGMDSGQVIARFEAERQALAMMDHENIARVFDAGTTPEGRPYFVMELVKGLPITKYCDEHKLSPRERLQLLIPVCQAIQHAHQKGIIHRDVKPSNVLVAIHDGMPVPKVIDFGIAKAIEQRLTEKTLFTELGQIIGTPEYMSPEQAEVNALDVDTRSDVYSLGVLLYELLTGSTPLDRQRLRQAAFTEMLRMIREEDPPRPSTKLSESGERLAGISAQRRTEPTTLARLIRGELDWIVMKALEKDRTRRYDSAAGLARDLLHYLADEPVEACPPSRGYLLRKFARKHRAFLATAAGVLAVLILGVIGLTVGIIAVSRARARAEQALQGQTVARKRTLTALNTTTDGVLPELIGRRDHMTDRERAFLRQIQGQYEGFADELGDSAEAREVAADGQYHVALIRAFLRERVGEVEAGFRRAIALYAALASEFPEVADYRYRLLHTHIGLGNALADSLIFPDAQAEFQQAITLGTALVDEFANIPEYRAGLARSHDEMGLLLRSQREWAAAETSLSQALELRKRLVEGLPRLPECRQALAGSYSNLGLLLHDAGDPRRRQEAEAALRRAIELQEKLAAEATEVPAYRNDLANSYDNLAIVLAKVDDRRQNAEAAYRGAIRHRRRLAEDFPVIPGYRFLLARTWFNLADLQFRTGQRQEGESTYQQGINLQKGLADDHPDHPEYRKELLDSYNNLGARLREDNHLAEAATKFHLAIDIGEKLIVERTVPLDHRISLAAAYSNLGNAVRDQKQPGAALPWYAKSIAVLEALPRDQQRAPDVQLGLRNPYWDRALAQGQLGHHDDALRDWQQALKLADSATQADPAAQLVYEAAQAYALAAAAAQGKVPPHEEYCRQAMARLTRANAAGFFRDARNLEQLKKDSELDALRQRPDFQKFLQEQAGGRK